MCLSSDSILNSLEVVRPFYSFITCYNAFKLSYDNCMIQISDFWIDW